MNDEMTTHFLRSAHAASGRPLRRGFSLLELMIVVAIIVILVGLTLAVITPILVKNEERTTRNILTQLDAAVEEWERSVDRRVTFQNATADTGNWDIPFNPDLNAAFSVAENTLAAPFNSSLPDQRTVFLLQIMGQQPNTRDLLAKIPSQYFHNTKLVNPTPSSGEFSSIKGAFDAWGTPIVAIFPGRDYGANEQASVIKDLDGTIRCVCENGTTPTTSGWGVCRNRRVLFVSAGPDQSFVDIASTTTVDERADNIYSYGQEGE